MSHPPRRSPSIDPLNTFSRHLLDDPSIERIYKVPREDFEGVWGVDPGGRGGVLAGPQPRPTRRCGAARLSSITRHPRRKMSRFSHEAMHLISLTFSTRLGGSLGVLPGPRGPPRSSRVENVWQIKCISRLNHILSREPCDRGAARDEGKVIARYAVG